MPRAGRVDRLSFAWCDSHGPMFARTADGHIATMVVLWDTTPQGRLKVDGDGPPGAVLEWILRDGHMEALSELQNHWPLEAHDVLVEGMRVSPCRQSLRAWEGFAGLEAVGIRRGQQLSASSQARASTGTSTVH